MNIAKIEKNAQEEIIVQLVKWKGHDLVDLRVWTKSITGVPEHPTKKGLTVKTELLPELIEALKKAYEEVQEKGV